MTTRDDITRWFNDAKSNGATHLLIVCDTFEYSNYPVEVLPSQSANAVYRQLNGTNMRKVEEVYDLSLSLTQQLNEVRAFHLPKV